MCDVGLAVWHLVVLFVVIIVTVVFRLWCLSVDACLKFTYDSK